MSVEAKVVKISDESLNNLEKNNFFYIHIDNSFINEIRLSNTKKIKFQNSFFKNGHFENIKNFFMNIDINTYIYRTMGLEEKEIFDKIIFNNVKHLNFFLPVNIAYKILEKIKIQNVETIYFKINFQIINIKKILLFLVNLMDFIILYLNKEQQIIIDNHNNLFKLNLDEETKNSVVSVFFTLKNLLKDFQNKYIILRELKNSVQMLYLKNICLFSSFNIKEPEFTQNNTKTNLLINSI